LDGDGSETFNYPNDASAAQTTYIRLNTYGAEVTIVSDGTNWQCINERLGQVPECWAYHNAERHLDIMNSEWAAVDLDTEEYDIGSNFNMATWVSGNCTSTSAGHIVDTGGAFTDAMLYKRVKNTTDSTFTYITAVNSGTDVTVRDDIFVDTEGYEIKHARFTFPITGRYQFVLGVTYSSGTVIADKDFACGVKENSTTYLYTPHSHTSNTGYITCHGAFISEGTASEYVELVYIHEGAVDTVDMAVGKAATFLMVKLLSKT